MENLAKYFDALIGSMPSIAPAQLEALLRCLPAAAYTCDLEGRITFHNDAAAELWGRTPRLHDREEPFCGAHALRDGDGHPLQRDECWMARALREQQSLLGHELTIERPNGEQVTVFAHAHLLYDESSKVRGGVSFYWQRNKQFPAATAPLAKSEEEMRDGEARLLAVIANAPGVAIQFYDAGERVVLWNRASEEMFGIREADAIGKTLFELTNTPEDFTRFGETCVQIERTGLPIGPREFEFRRKDGSKGIALSTQFLIPGPRGQRWHACMDVDITERKRSEEAERQSRELIQLILDNIPQGVVWKDRESRYVSINATVRRAMGIGDQDVRGKTDLDFDTISPEQAKFFMEKDREVMERDQSQYQIVEPMDVADGKTIWLNTNKIPLHDSAGNVTGVLVTWEDFTEKRQISESQQLSIAWLHRAQSIAKLGAWTYDCAKGRFQSPEGGHRILRLGPGLKRAEDLFRMVHPDDYLHTKRAWHAAIAGATLDIIHRIYVRKELRWFAIRAEPEFDEAGDVTRLVGVTQDITERKRLEDQLIQAQKYEGLGILAGGMAHEFNNILTSVLGNAELGLMNSPAESPATPIFAEIGKAARRAAGLTKQMLAYSGRGQIQIAPIQLDAIARDAIPMLRSVASEKAELKWDLSSAPCSGDTVQLRLVVLQLVSNAVEALEGRPGLVTISAGEVALVESDLVLEFALPPKCAGRFAFFEVSDTGCGMSTEVVAKIFDPFFSTKFAGRGLGLAAVMGIIKRHSGAVQVKTSPGSGTTIRVLIPQIAAARESSSAIPATASSKKPLWVLLIEDEFTVREFLAQLLRGAGYQVVAAGDGAEGIQLAHTHQAEIGLVLLDLLMPRMDGWSAFSQLRGILPNTPIIIMSGNGEAPEVNTRNQMIGAAAYLAKPFRPNQFFATIKQALATVADE